MSARYRCGAWALLIAGIGQHSAGFGMGEAAEAAKDDPSAPETRRVYVTLSRETTHLVEPLGKHGYVDYLKAVNDDARQGVTPTNNAAILFWQAVGPKDIPRALRSAFFKGLQIPSLPEKGEYFLDWDDFVKEIAEPHTLNANRYTRQGLDNEFWDARHGPWSERDFPHVAAWLARNRIPLQRILEASQRERFFYPLLNENGPPDLIGTHLPTPRAFKEITRSLTARAMLNLQKGSLGEVRQDILVCHRLSRLLAQRPDLVEYAHALGVECRALEADATVACRARLARDAAIQWSRELQSLPPLPSATQKMDWVPRLLYLDTVAATAVCGPDILQGKRILTLDRQLSLIRFCDYCKLVEWNQVLEMGNRLCDRQIEACREATYAERRGALKRIYSDLYYETRRAIGDFGPGLLQSLVARPPRQRVTQVVGRIWTALLLDGIDAARDAEDKAAVWLDLARVALALAAYHADHDAYPPKLSELSPAYITAIPKDRFSDEQLSYVPDADGYLLYSVGENAEDDHGVGSETTGDADDIAIRCRETAPLVGNR